MLITGAQGTQLCVCVCVCVCLGFFKTANCQGENIFAHSLSRRTVITEPTDSLVEVKRPQSTWKS